MNAADHARAQWYWKSNSNPWLNNEKEEWTRYSDIQSDIIEHTFDQTMNTNLVELDNYWIDLKRSVQISKHDQTKQRQIKRMLITADDNECLRKERFFFPEPLKKPFNEDRLDGGYHGFIKEWETKGKTFLFFWQEKNKEICNSDKVEQAAKGIILEGNRLGKKDESQWIAEKLRSVKNRPTDEIRQCCIMLYSKECFLYKLVNKTLRENDKTKVDTLAPFCYFLFDSWSNDSKNQYKMEVYRGANLDREMIECYKEAIGTYKCWYGFSSTSKTRHKAEAFGNTLFTIDLTKTNRGGFDISSYSSYPHEEEVLLPAGTAFKIISVQSEMENNKHCISLAVLNDLDTDKSSDFSNKGLSAKDARTIANTLKIRKTLRELYISNNNISNEGATSIAHALKINTTLEWLYMSNNNNISNEGATSIAHGFFFCNRVGYCTGTDWIRIILN
ncbi:unnamed protein product [Didymodactylos carnosus]|uniref:WWE domain-containing protein n=1 Tax=Didymodactylos carnosus TaxID=1234261 RepID=A0A8S2RCI3_9BILA|nr:unnamed protein product [Didymodactylos carnosus]CAF4157779.1 unnamed protein product [Didymodactylos carnosus]